MGINAATLAAMVNESNYDSDFSLLFNQSYQKLSSEDALSTSCVNLLPARLTILQSLYSRVLNGTASTSLIWALYPLTIAPAQQVYYSLYTPAQLVKPVQLALEIELGVRNSLAQPVSGTQKPTQLPYGCVGVVLEALNVSSGAFKYRLRTEYDPTLDPSQGSFLDQSSAPLLGFDLFHNVIYYVSVFDMHSVFDMLSMPCGSSTSLSLSAGISCPADVYQQNRFVATQIALDEAFLQVGPTVLWTKAKL